MVILRPTRKLYSALQPTDCTEVKPDTALGDWYVNRLVVDRKPLLLLVSSASLLPVLVPARDVRGLPCRLASIVESRLRRCGIEKQIVAAELSAMSPVVIAPTVDRSVVGIMVDFAKGIPCYLTPGQWDDSTLRSVEEHLAETPCHAGRGRNSVIIPKDKAPELLRASHRWLGSPRDV